jgi:hypothetical protein
MSSDETSEAAAGADDTPRDEAPRAGFSRRWLAVILGSLLALATVAAWLAFFAPDRLPAIDQARFDAARKLWNEKGPASYDMTVAVTGIEPAVYEASVRDGKPTRVLRNGSPLTQRRTLGTWSVPGMFATIAADLARASDPIRINPREVQNVTAQGEFDPRFGYPARYRRIQWGNDYEVSWKVTKFDVVK